VVVFLTVGVPRWLAGDHAPIALRSAASFARLCREHGGTPATTPGPGSTGAQSLCTVRYGQRVYRMDAITPDGFDEDTARFQRQGCLQANREQRSLTGPGHRPRFIYHPTTGVCEHRL
jgi:hypothetical protein